jgi:hypothetical protein
MCVCVLPSLLPSDRPAGDLHVLLHILISHQFTHKKHPNAGKQARYIEGYRVT